MQANKKIKIPQKSLILWALFWSVTILAPPSLVLAQGGGDDPSEFDDIQRNPIIEDLEQLINFLSVGVAVIVVGAIIVGGIQYMTASGNPQAVSAAKSRIVNALIALVAFIFTYAFLQWLVPGGVFG